MLGLHDTQGHDPVDTGAAAVQGTTEIIEMDVPLDYILYILEDGCPFPAQL